MDGKSVWTIGILGLGATVLLTFMMSYSLQQVTGGQTQQITTSLVDELENYLAPAPPANVRVTLKVDARQPGAPKTYTVHIHLRPTGAVAAQLASVDLLLRQAAESCCAQLDRWRGELMIVCGADLGNRGEREAKFLRVSAGDRDAPAEIRSIGSAETRCPPQAATGSQPVAPGR